MSPEQKDHLDYAWRHYALIADQRMRTFNFYCILLAASIAGTAAAISSGRDTVGFLVVLSLSNMVMGIVFGALDYRSNSMIRLAKKALAEVETDCLWPRFRIAEIDEHRFDKEPILRAFTFTRAIWTMCACQFLVGLVVIVLGALGHLAKVVLPPPSGPDNKEIQRQYEREPSQPFRRWI